MTHIARRDRDELIYGAMTAARTSATAFARRFSTMDLDDAVSAAYEALVLAADRYDRTASVRFTTFAASCVTNALHQLLRDHDVAGWRDRAIARKYHAARALNPDASLPTVADVLGFAPAVVRRALDACATFIVSADSVATDVAAPDVLPPSTDPTPEAVVVELEFARVRRRVLRDAVADLPAELADAVNGAASGNLSQYARDRGVPMQTMHSRLQRARAILRPVLAEVA
jgi:DNA-directed RNA polymerase specialized sigma subunit